MNQIHFNIERDFLLLLSASIDPLGKAPARADPLVREQDYRGGLKFALENYPRIRKIVFVENSGWPLDRIESVASDNPLGKEIEFISLSLNDYPPEYGKGYGESMLLDEAMSRSRLVLGVTHVGKTNGRLTLHNMSQIIERSKFPFDFLCDLRDYRNLLTGKSHHYCDTRALFFSRSYFDRHLKGMSHARDVLDEFWYEHEVYRIAKRTVSSGLVRCRFRVEPEFHGVAGHENEKDFAKDPIHRVKQRIRRISRRITPWLWI